jgi:hypothetical protein
LKRPVGVAPRSHLYSYNPPVLNAIFPFAIPHAGVCKNIAIAMQATSIAPRNVPAMNAKIFFESQSSNFSAMHVKAFVYCSKRAQFNIAESIT